MWRLTLPASLMLLSLTTCASTGQGDGCSWVRPIYLDSQDQLSPATGREIDAHNNTWMKVCGP